MTMTLLCEISMGTEKQRHLHVFYLHRKYISGWGISQGEKVQTLWFAVPVSCNIGYNNL